MDVASETDMSGTDQRMRLVVPPGIDMSGINDVAESPRERVERLQRENDAALQALAQRGIQIPQHELDHIRLVLLTEHLLGEMDAPGRLEFERRVQETFAAEIASVQGQVSRAVLLGGV